MSKSEMTSRILAVVALVLALGMGVWTAIRELPEAEEAVPRSYSCAVYTEQGCAKYVVASGGEIEIQSGGTFDLQSGATTDFSSGVDLDGGLLDLDADGDTSLQADTDDQIDVEISAADDFRFTANTFTALSGSSIAANTVAETTAASGVTIDGLTLKDGGVQDAGGFPITGQADVVQLTVTGYSTQTNNTFVVENSSAADLFWVTDNGDVEMNGTTPALTIGDAGEEDTSIVFDGAAQDFYIGLDDTADDLVFGKGSALGTTQAFGIDENQVTIWSGGTLLLTEAASSADTITAAECGKTFFMSGDDYTLTLPAVSGVAAGCEFRFIIAGAPTTSTVVLTGNSDEDVLIGGINELEVDTGDDGPYDASADTITFVGGTAVVGDFVYMICDGSYYYVSGQANADGGVTITDSD